MEKVMKYVTAENESEQLAFKSNLINFPSIHGYTFNIFSKVVLNSLQLDIFEAAKDSPVTIDQIAEKTGLNIDALKRVMIILVVLDYFKIENDKYSLTKMARVWCLKDSPFSYYKFARFYEIMGNNMAHLKEYLRTGQGIDLHNTMSDEEWDNYQIAMENHAIYTSNICPQITPVSENPSEMLDIGGSHGLYSIELCKKYPTLKATIIDLPQVEEFTKSILKKHNMEDRIKFQTGNALVDDFGENKYDLIFVSSLLHHFKSEENHLISKKIAKALKQNGYYVIQEYIKPVAQSVDDLSSILMDLCWSITSTSGTWTLDELKEFQNKEGLMHYSVNRYDGFGTSLTQICAKKTLNKAEIKTSEISVTPQTNFLKQNIQKNAEISNPDELIKIDYSEAENYIGRQATVFGKVEGVKEYPDFEVTTISIGKPPETPGAFPLAIQDSIKDQFPPDLYNKKNVSVTGVIEINPFGGVTMTINNPTQFEVQ
jgi:ubiquinone/menaquinone biosynthesis C-methylase UbiE